MITRYNEEVAKMRVFTQLPRDAGTILATPATFLSNFNNL